MWEWLVAHSKEFSEVITLGTLITGGGLWVVKMLIAGRKRFEAMFAETKLMKTQNEALAKSVDEIVSQLKPNGGHSLFDMVKSAYKLSQENSEAVAGLYTSLDRIHAYQWSFAETISDKPIWESDVKGNCLKVNIALAKLAERTAAEFVGAGWENIIHPNDRVRVYEEWADAIERRRTFESNYRIKTPSNRVYQVKAVALPIFTEKGMLVSYVGRYDSVTEEDRR